MATWYRESGLTGGAAKNPYPGDNDLSSPSTKLDSSDPTTPGTANVNSKVSSRLHLVKTQCLAVSGDSSLQELRDFIDSEKLPVSKGIGGRNRRTKKDVLVDIQRVWDQQQAFLQEDNEMVDSPHDPGGMTVHLPREMSLASYLRIVDRQLGGLDNLVRQARERSIRENRLLGSVRDFQVGEPAANGLAKLLGFSTRQMALVMSKGEEEIVAEFKQHGTEQVWPARYT